eukprot:scaffold31_cov334-Pavlova_lutheri.AAC.61
MFQDRNRIDPSRPRVCPNLWTIRAELANQKQLVPKWMTTKPLGRIRDTGQNSLSSSPGQRRSGTARDEERCTLP